MRDYMLCKSNYCCELCGEATRTLNVHHKIHLDESNINDYNISLNEDRIITEVSLIVDRLDITEELVRLESHFNQKDEIMKEYPLGRKLEFLLQEISREFNTIASKISDAVVQSNVVEAKAELEKIREQIQNIE